MKIEMEVEGDRFKYAVIVGESKHSGETTITPKLIVWFSKTVDLFHGLKF